MTNNRNDFFESKQFVETLLEQLSERIYWKNEKGVYQGCNAPFAKSLGYTCSEDIIGKTDDLLVDPIKAEALRKSDDKVMRTGEAVVTEELLSAEGEERTVRTQKTPLYDEHKKMVGLLGISVDTTELTQAKQAAQAQINKTESAHRSNAEFLSVASHEIRGPVANVVTCLQLLEFELKEYVEKVETLQRALSAHSQHSDPQLLEYLSQSPDSMLEVILKTSQEASRALNALGHLDELYRLKIDGVNSECVTLDMEAFIKKTVESLLQNNPNQVIIHTNIAEFPHPLSVDSRNLRDVIKIVITNAMRFSKRGGEVFVDVVPLLKENKHTVSISVRDNGCGIPKEQISTLFTTFLDNGERVINTRYRKPSFQLPVAEMKMKAMGGEVNIESEVGKETVVMLLCPYEVSSMDVAKQTILPSIQTCDIVTNTTLPLHFLLVEDDPITLDIEKNQLQALGYSTDVAMNGQEALQLASQQKYDVIWMDITLPDMSGIDTMKNIKKLSKTPIDFIAVTSHATDQDEDHFISEGMTTVLVKPTTVDHFRECIKRITAGRLETAEN